MKNWIVQRHSRWVSARLSPRSSSLKIMRSGTAGTIWRASAQLWAG